MSLGTTVDDIRLPIDIETGAQGGPSFRTSIVQLSSGKEQRVAEWVYERNAWDIGYGIQTKEEYRDIVDFFRARRGRHRGFRFRDWTDYEIINEQIGVGDGIRREFQIVKTYLNVYARKITRPISGTLSLTIDNVPKTTGFSVDYNTGIVAFNNTETDIPGEGAIVSVTCEFDLPVRFQEDRLSVSLRWFNAGRIPSIPIIELIE